MNRPAAQPLVIPPMPPLVLAELRAQIEPGWGGEAVCASEWVDPDWWFAPADDPDQEAARGICGACPVHRSCLAYALVTSEPHGIWGGYDDSERAWLRL